jgi:hypothetical protein
MKKPKPSLDGFRLMDRLTPDASHGRLVAILATSYELQAEFFETDYLPTLLGLGAWDDRAWTSRIALEKSLAELEAATVLADAHPYRGRPRSLRVEVAPVPLDAGRALHAKVMLAVYEDAVRMLVGSANLTEPGYRRNREVVAALSASVARTSQARLIAGAMHQFEELLGSWLTPGARQCVQLAVDRLDTWTTDDEATATEWFAWSGGKIPLWEQFLLRWPLYERIERITIVSPFWSDEDESGPITTFVRAVRERNALSASATLQLMTEACPDTEQSYKPVLPESFGSFDARSLDIEAAAVAIDPRETDTGDGSSAVRPLHAKVVLLEGLDTSLIYLGSANFTRHGWGFLNNALSANVEGGLIVRRNGEARKQLRGLLPKTSGAPVPLAGAASGRLALPESSPQELPWPAFLREALLAPSEQDPEHLDLVLTVSDVAAGPWSVAYLTTEATSQELLFSTESPGDSELVHRITLTRDALGRLLRDQEVHVRWWKCPEGRAFPLNVAQSAKTALPISPGSARPEEAHLIAYYQGRIAREDLCPDPDTLSEIAGVGAELVEAQGVDTSRIQSYIVREFVEALKGINDDLKRAAMAPKASMRLALLGPVSPVALARRVLDAVDHGRTPTAAGFQLVEILACLNAARCFECAPRFRNDWITVVDDAARQVAGIFTALERRFPSSLTQDFHRYASAVRDCQAAMVPKA